MTVIGQSVLRPLSTDYCTNYPEGTPRRPDQWKHCCLIHDMYFWAGGSKGERYEADLELKNCIEASGARRMAQLVFLAVRAGSYSPIKYTNKKWNNGWQGRSDFRSLTGEEINLIEMELARGYDFISFGYKDNFVKKLRSRLD